MQRPAHKTAPRLEEIKILAGPILRKHDVAHASVFGSLATGTGGPDSDLDLLIEFKPGIIKSLLDLARLQKDLEATLGCKVDIGFAHTLKPRIRERVLSEQIAIL